MKCWLALCCHLKSFSDVTIIYTGSPPAVTTRSAYYSPCSWSCSTTFHHGCSASPQASPKKPQRYVCNVPRQYVPSTHCSCSHNMENTYIQKIMGYAHFPCTLGGCLLHVSVMSQKKRPWFSLQVISKPRRLCMLQYGCCRKAVVSVDATLLISLCNEAGKMPTVNMTKGRGYRGNVCIL